MTGYTDDDVTRWHAYAAPHDSPTVYNEDGL